MAKINSEYLDEVMAGFLKNDKSDWSAEREEKDDYLRAYLKAEAIDDLDEGTLRELIHLLWSFNGWTNKDWVLEEMLKSGLDNIRGALKDLLYGTDSLAKRFDRTRNDVRMMGAATISEILAHHDPHRYPIWNRKSREGLIALGIPETNLPRSAQISGESYAAFCDLVTDVHKQVASQWPEVSDLFELDYLLYYIAEKGQKPPEVTEAIQEDGRIKDFDHDEVIQQVLKLGDGLGFEVDDEFDVVQGCRIDALWRTRIANLGTISYAFEVHRRGSRDSAILNLQRVRRDPSIQKVVIVSTVEELERFQGEISSLDEGFRNAVTYFSVDELQEALDHLEELKDILNGLGLLRQSKLSA